MPRGKDKPDYTYEEYLEIKKENKRKLEEILTTPDYMETLGKKYYGDRWFTIFPDGHFKRKDRFEKVRTGQIKVVGYIDRELIQLDLEGNKIREYSSAREWADENGKEYSAAQHVAKCALGTQMGGNETAYGYKWKFKEDE